jgi:hypothetical protein
VTDVFWDAAMRMTLAVFLLTATALLCEGTPLLRGR